MVYRPLEALSQAEIDNIIERNQLEELMLLPLSVGEYHSNWKYAQQICVKLCEHEHASIRANAVLGFGYIARTKGCLEKHIVKPLILRELRSNPEHSGRIMDAISDINLYMDWQIGKHATNIDR